ncbi:unnamed protein product [Leuciscus chuanchicus]
MAENKCRELSSQNTTNNVHVYSGPIYRSLMNPPWFQEKLVPTHFFKVIIVENKDGTVRKPECYVFPNGNLDQENLGDLTKHRKTIKQIEEVSGLTFIERRPNHKLSAELMVEVNVWRRRSITDTDSQ